VHALKTRVNNKVFSRTHDQYLSSELLKLTTHLYFAARPMQQLVELVRNLRIEKRRNHQRARMGNGHRRLERSFLGVAAASCAPI
jgi:hypothetical protein